MRDAVTPDLNEVYESPNHHQNHLKGNMINLKRGITEIIRNQNASGFDEDVTRTDSDELLIDEEMEIIESAHSFPMCENIDEAMTSLHTLSPLPLESELPRNSSTMQDGGIIQKTEEYMHPYDWILDGDPTTDIEEDVEKVGDQVFNPNDINIPPRKSFDGQDDSHKLTGSTLLELTLGGLELEVVDHDNDCRLSKKKNKESRKVIAKEIIHGTCNRIRDNNDDETDVSDVTENVAQHDLNNALSQGASYCDYFRTERIDFKTLLRSLPHADPSTLEGKFTRRLQDEYEKEESFNKWIANHDIDNVDKENKIYSLSYLENKSSLSAQFFTSDYDPMVEILKELKWNSGIIDEPKEESRLHGSSSNVDIYLAGVLSSLDEESRNVNEMLVHHISSKEKVIEHGMKGIQELDHDVSSAISCANEATSYLKRSRGRGFSSIGGKGGILGGMSVVEESERRDKLRDIDAVLTSYQDLIELENAIYFYSFNMKFHSAPIPHEFSLLIEKCKQLKSRVMNEEQIFRLDALQNMKHRASNIFQSLYRRVQDNLVDLVSEAHGSYQYSAAKEIEDEDRRISYSNFLNAHLTLHESYEQECRENMVLNINGQNGDELEMPNLASDWINSIFKALFFEADKCLARALLDPTLDGKDMEEDTSEFDTNLLEIRLKINDIQAGDTDAASLRSLTQNLLAIRFEFDKGRNHLPWVYHKLCELLANVLYSFYRLEQWHLYLDDGDPDRFGLSIVDERSDDIDEKKEDRSENLTLSTSSSPVSFESSENETHVAVPQCISGQNKYSYDFVEHQREKICDISKEMEKAKARLWHYCKSIIVTFLKVYQSYSVKTDHDLDSLHDLHQLSNQFVSIGNEFVGSNALNFLPNDRDCDIQENLRILFRRFIRQVQAESMNEIGKMLANETWEQTISTADLDSSPIPTKKTLRKSDFFTSRKTRPWMNSFSNQNIHQIFPHFPTIGNPFTMRAKSLEESRMPSINVIDEINRVAASCARRTGFSVLTKTAVYGIGKWTLKLLEILKLLPLVSDEITDLISNVHDIYFLAVFRLCSGTSSKERIAIGLEARSDSTLIKRFPQDVMPAEKVRSIGISTKRRESRRLNVPISGHCEADIAAPLRVELESVLRVKKFVVRGQEMLKGMINFDLIESWNNINPDDDSDDETPVGLKTYAKQVIAAFSCLFVSSLLEALLDSSDRRLSEQLVYPHLNGFHGDFSSTENFVNEVNEKLQEYSASSNQMISHMHTVCMRMITLSAIGANDIVTEVRLLSIFLHDVKLKN